MAITMTCHSLTWTDRDGIPQASVVSYDRPSADHRKTRLEGEGCTNAQIVETKPGELPKA
ncbi:hypothetical protein [Streptomyces sp. NBC_00151]|uniref:hypothetical protein n=1 Tax=Streptomyces sp. NBC_00151 TaxID=2975669 RepID=UPI002DD8888E|nr:hypothetical protein [Streptomyces sp. NBC_00151]WRZ44595.1 hypothetical protein OG915_45355 [Streptomyces sp. NBC_00151]